MTVLPGGVEVSWEGPDGPRGLLVIRQRIGGRRDAVLVMPMLVPRLIAAVQAEIGAHGAAAEPAHQDGGWREAVEA